MTLNGSSESEQTLWCRAIAGVDWITRNMMDILGDTNLIC